MEKILMHMCCGPCSIFPVKESLKNEYEVEGYYYNPNIHPHDEYIRRRDGTQILSDAMDVKVHHSENYDADKFFKRVTFTKEDGHKGHLDHGERCWHCYDIRMGEVARMAKEKGFDYFSTALLYSKYQNHEIIIEACERASHEHEIKFYYDDFRVGWGRGIKWSKKMRMYRQNYCGCIYSKKEREEAIAEANAKRELEEQQSASSNSEVCEI